MSAPHFFFRPLLAADRSWIAIDWQSSEQATSADLARCFSDSRAAPLARLMHLVAGVNPEWLHDAAFVGGFAGSPLIFVLPADSLENAQTIERCIALRKQGHRFGIQIATADGLLQVPTEVFDYVQLDAAFARQEVAHADLLQARKAGLRKIATRVGSYEMFDWLADKGFSWYDSRFLTARNPHFGKEPDLTRLKLLKLLNLVKQDGDTHAIEAIFREEPKLSYTLLRLVNSVAVGARTRISNFSQAIALLGRRQLQRWLQLLIYADNLAEGHAANPLMQYAAARGRQLELLSMAIEPKPAIRDFSDNAFMTGLFSLLDVLINLPMQDILKELPLNDVVLDALISPAHRRAEGGVLDQLLGAVMAGEANNYSLAEAIFSDLGISPAAHAQAQVAALHWASQINVDRND